MTWISYSRERNAGEPMPYIGPEDYPYEIGPKSVRGSYGDGNPWVQWLMAYAPDLARLELCEFRRIMGAFRYRLIPAAPRRKKAA